MNWNKLTNNIAFKLLMLFVSMIISWIKFLFWTSAVSIIS